MTHEKQTAVNAVEEKKELICQAADHIWSNPESLSWKTSPRHTTVISLRKRGSG